MDTKRIRTLIATHLDTVCKNGTDRYGPESTAMWMSSLDTRTLAYPENDSRPDGIPKRAYRYIEAPKGSNLYWDLPQIAAAFEADRLFGAGRWAGAAEEYVATFLERSRAKNGIFLWGNHYYYDAFIDRTVRFGGTPQPVDFETEAGELHEMRPLPPAWDAVARVSAEAVEKEISVASLRHLSDPVVGEFNRHATPEKDCDFIEAGGILVESLAWLYRRTSDPALLDRARRIAHYSYSHRDRKTGLMEVKPAYARWDKYNATTEIGLWAGSLLRAADYASNDEFVELADAGLRAFLEQAWDPERGRYYGRVQVATGEPTLGEKSSQYQPSDYSELWEPLFPAHDYPFQCAEAAYALFKRTGAETYRTACDRWIEVIRAALPARDGRGGYAEHYGRCIHFLHHAAADFPAAGPLVEQVVEEAIETLWAESLFRTHPGENRYDAIDEPGVLLLALLEITAGSPVDAMGFGW